MLHRARYKCKAIREFFGLHGLFSLDVFPWNILQKNLSCRTDRSY